MSQKPSPSIDECLRALPVILENQERLEAQLTRIETMLKAGASGIVEQFYDVNDLRQKLGMGRNRAYEILRIAGHWRAGRKQVSQAELANFFDTYSN